MAHVVQYLLSYFFNIPSKKKSYFFNKYLGLPKNQILRKNQVTWSIFPNSNTMYVMRQKKNTMYPVRPTRIQYTWNILWAYRCTNWGRSMHFMLMAAGLNKILTKKNSNWPGQCLCTRVIEMTGNTSEDMAMAGPGKWLILILNNPDQATPNQPTQKAVRFASI